MITITGNRKKIHVFFIFLLTVCLCLYMASCDPKQTGTVLGESFSKIYNRNDTASYTALDVKQIPGNGYIILGKMGDYPYLLRINERGDVMWDTKNEAILKRYENPVPDLLVSNQGYYFFCSGQFEDKLVPILLKINEDRQVNEIIAISSYINHYAVFGLPYSITPKHASIMGESNYSLVTLNNIGDAVVFIGDENNDNGWREKVDDIPYWAGWACLTAYPSTERIIHYSGILKEKGRYYFHTYQNAPDNVIDLARCFMIEMEAPDGSGFHPEFYLEKPLIAMDWNVSQWDNSQWNGIRISGAYIDKEEDNNIVSLFVNSGIIMDEETNQGQIETNKEDKQPELNAFRPVYIKTIAVNGRDIVFFTGSTKFDQIVLYACDRLTGTWMEEVYFGEKRLYEAAGLIETGDNGLAILGITYIMDLQERICLFKLSKAELENIVNSPGN